MKNILSLFDHSGVWSGPYRRAGYDVTQVDLKDGMDVMLIDADNQPAPVHGILAAPPCTDFTISGSRWWKDKDKDGRTEASLELVRHTLRIVRGARGLTFWSLENPVGRLGRLLPELGKPLLVWQPWWFGDPYTKRTCLWGSFNPNLPRTPVEPVMYETANGKRGSWMWAKLGGKSARTKELRSVTPPGFAEAFFEVNP
jgi:hypothetical protein